MTDSQRDPAPARPRSTAVIVVVISGESGYAQLIEAGGHELRADEPLSAGGSASGPRPTELVLAGLGACTSITLRMYAQREGWKLGTIRVTVALRDEDGVARIERRIGFSVPLSVEQRERLSEISEKTPVTKMLKAGIAIQTSLT
jgi:putative redox protein